MSIARSVVGGIVTAVALGLTACGEERVGDHDTDRGTDRSAVEVVAAEYRLEPPTVRVARAGAVVLRYVNEGRGPHVLAVDGPQGVRRTPPVQPGASHLLRLALPKGTYRLSCPLDHHADRGMVARLRVAE